MAINRLVDQTWPSLLSERCAEYQPAPSHLFPSLVVRKMTQKEVDKHTKRAQTQQESKETQTEENQVDHKSKYTQTEIPGPETRNQEKTKRPTLGVAQIRRRCQLKWKDWECIKCQAVNPATWYTCNREGCDGEATDRQLPMESWHCKLSCGQSNWAGDHWCNACMRKNTLINPFYLKPKPKDMVSTPRSRQQWLSGGPVIKP